DRLAYRSGVRLKRFTRPVHVIRIDIRPSTSVDEQCRAVGHRNQRRVALTNVKKVNMKFTVRAKRDVRMKNDRRGRQQKCYGGESPVRLLENLILAALYSTRMKWIQAVLS